MSVMRTIWSFRPDSPPAMTQFNHGFTRLWRSGVLSWSHRTEHRSHQAAKSTGLSNGSNETNRRPTRIDSSGAMRSISRRWLSTEIPTPTFSGQSGSARSRSHRSKTKALFARLVRSRKTDCGTRRQMSRIRSTHSNGASSCQTSVIEQTKHVRAFRHESGFINAFWSRRSVSAPAR